MWNEAIEVQPLGVAMAAVPLSHEAKIIFTSFVFVAENVQLCPVPWPCAQVPSLATPPKQAAHSARSKVRYLIVNKSAETDSASRLPLHW